MARSGRIIGLAARLRGLLGPGHVRQSLVALGLNSSTSLVAGAILGSITETFEALPGLLVLVPAAIGLRGNVFSALGSRLSTAIHVGTFRFSARPGTVLGQNVLASLILTVAMSVALAVVGKVVAVALGVTETIPLAHLALISILGGVVASLVVLVATVALAQGSVRYGWDLDNVTAPLVSTLGDVLTLPALWMVSFLVGFELLATILGIALVVLSLVGFGLGLRSPLPVLRRVIQESAPILFAAVCLSTLAGIVIEQRLDTFTTFPALLVLVPAFISSAGALGGILSSRLSSKLHLGLADPRAIPGREARRDAGSVFLLGVPVFLFNGAGAHLVGSLLGQASPGLGAMVAASVIGGVISVALVTVIAYYGTIASYGVGLDPDTYGVPVVTSSVDFVGAVILIVTIVSVGIT